ncbi:MBL fold metallo-hydrolase [Pelagovum pacificum]|uniref:MBL fold metallo-hydrolase n=1 Tax=Pelagovum pacificum TaxID=2588711 RepID=A0A5C5GCV3_9RHOB|nr:MBL fold metallo-hydrolase [Pelagovum pacificum]QQA44243.1 MBL fold metallo-hydrolase [Pelagovum pacificum]TNY32635.1 MBL fold metallo-hydrolase [Pelagovum pacificum]
MTALPDPAESPAPGVVRVLAPNPGPFTYRGTNSYVVGDARLLVIDPGPDDDAHLDALLAVIAGRPVEAIVVTHAHADHSALAPRLTAGVDAPIFAFGGPEAGRSAVMQALAASGDLGGGEGVDRNFRPHRLLADGESVPAGDLPLTALHTPGHMGNHLCLLGDGLCFSGDLVMSWSSTLISPPDGDLTQFNDSCRRLLANAPALLLPGHGDPVDEPDARIRWLLDHRAGRSAQILDALAASPLTVPELAASLYSDQLPQVLPAAERVVLAHLVDLHTRDLVTAEPALAVTARFARRKA